MSDDVPSLRGPLPMRMRLCPRCSRHVRGEESSCPHCSADVGTLWREHDEAMEEFRASAEELKRILGMADPGS